MSVSIPSTSRIQMLVPQLASDYNAARALQRLLEEVAEAAVREAVQQAKRDTVEQIRRATR